MDFNIDASEEQVLFLVVGHMDAGNPPTAEELSGQAGRAGTLRVKSSRFAGRAGSLSAMWTAARRSWASRP
ncbi:hypothetical protein GCM10010359_40140 [Streptomyces morookaense]|nr:hypothetical protein GCM10010359_40140 [Streptomyces morookaense]